MSTVAKQHLIDPEICIRCHTCENTCPIQAITHNDDNVVVDADICNFCMDCIPVCPTGSIDHWRVVREAYSVEEQLEWMELPEQEELSDNANVVDTTIEALDETVATLLAEAHSGAGGRPTAPTSASKPSINLYSTEKPATAKVQGNYRLTDITAENDVRHIILDFAQLPFPVLEGQSIGIIAPGTNDSGKSHQPRLYSISSPRDGERANFNNVSLTVKRETEGVCSNYVCDLQKGDEVTVTGPFGSSFLLPNDSAARLLMICTGTGSAPFRAFTMQRQRTGNIAAGGMTLVFGARTPQSLPYFGPLKKIPKEVLQQHLVFSRIPGQSKQYVQDALLENRTAIADIITDQHCHIYVCGLRAMEEGVDKALSTIATEAGLHWSDYRDSLRDAGRYHVETY